MYFEKIEEIPNIVVHASILSLENDCEINKTNRSIHGAMKNRFECG